MKMQTERLLGIDITRALAIVLVVIGHWQPEYAPSGWLTFVKWIYTFHMPLFLFISGYLFARSPRPYGKLLKGKVFRLLVPYFTASVIIITMKLLTPGNLSLDHPVTPKAYLEMFWYPSAGKFLWFIWVLWWCFCIVPLFKGRRSHLILFVLTAIMAYMPGQFTPLFAFDALKWNLVWFVAGVVAFDYKEFIRFDSAGVAVFSSLGMIVLSVGYLSEYGFCGYLLPYFGCIAPVAVSTVAAPHLGKSLKVLLSLSAASYIIYLFHTTFEGVAKSILHRFFPDISFWLISLLVISAGVLLPWAMNYCLQYCPRIIKVLFGLEKPKRSDS